MEQNSTLNNTSKGLGYYTLQFVRIFVGVLFIFSGLIKANDPSGLSYKMQEFFELWNMHGLSDYALFFSVTVILFEIVAGVALLIGFKYRTFAFLILLLMVFFTFLTGYAVWYENKTQSELACGCFGDCIPLKAVQSLWKDIILLVLIIILLLFRNKIKPLFSTKIGVLILLITTLLTLYLQNYALKNLPYVDCLPYKIGNNIREKMNPPVDGKPDVYQTTYHFKNTATGEEKAFPEEEFLSLKVWEDTNWVASKEADVVLIEKGNMTPETIGFRLSDFDGEDYTEYIMNDTAKTLLWFVRDVTEASLENIATIQNLAKASETEGFTFYMVTSSDAEATNKFLVDNKLEVYTVSLDPTTSKTVIRTNPGLMLLQDGKVLGKWSYKNYPTQIK